MTTVERVSSAIPIRFRGWELDALRDAARLQGESISSYVRRIVLDVTAASAAARRESDRAE